MLNSVIITARWITAKIKKLIFEFLFSAIVYYLQHFYKYGSIVWKTWFCKGKTIDFTFICLKVKFLKLITSIWIESYGLTKIYVLKKFQEGKHVCIFFFNKFRYWWIFLWNHVWKIRFIFLKVIVVFCTKEMLARHCRVVRSNWLMWRTWTTMQRTTKAR